MTAVQGIPYEPMSPVSVVVSDGIELEVAPMGHRTFGQFIVRSNQDAAVDTVRVTISASVTDTTIHDEASEEEFRRLAEQWHSETDHLSILARTILHPAYQRIIGIGMAAVPFILRDLKKTRGHWFWALHMITGRDPASGIEEYDGAVQAWLKWGEDAGHLEKKKRRPRD